MCRVSVHGEERLLQTHVDFLRDEHGTPWRIVGIVQDITEWAQSRAALKESDALHAAVVDSALDAVMKSSARHSGSRASASAMPGGGTLMVDTARAGDSDLLDHHGVADGSTRLLEKPFDSVALLDSVRAALASE